MEYKEPFGFDALFIYVVSPKRQGSSRSSRAPTGRRAPTQDPNAGLVMSKTMIML
jgi:hypothetical protein